jgi:hypothetical protein
LGQGLARIVINALEKEPFMEEPAPLLLLRLFRDMPDPRLIGKISHKLHDILVITVCAVLCGLEHWTQIEDFGKAHEAWFRTFLDLRYSRLSNQILNSLR